MNAVSLENEILIPTNANDSFSFHSSCPNLSLQNKSIVRVVFAIFAQGIEETFHNIKKTIIQVFYSWVYIITTQMNPDLIQ